MAVELIQNLGGDAADKLIANNFDIGVLRPWKGRDGKSYWTKTVYNENTGKLEKKVQVSNAPATMTKDAWIAFDAAIIRALRERLRAFADIRGAGLVYNLPNGMAHTMLQYQTQSDIGRATLSMDPIRRSEADRPTTDLANFPLPVVHKDFDFSAREILTSQQGNMPVDTTTAETAARKVADEIEMLTTGVSGTFSYGGATIYGYTNFPNRILKADMTVPNGTNGVTTVNEFLALRQSLINAKHFGPYMVYVNSQWAQWLDVDFSTTKGDNTLRQRLMAIDGIQDIRTLDWLPTTNWHIVMVEMTTETVRAIIGLEVQTVQWESLGGFMKHFKVLALQLPQLRADTAGNSGVAHGRSVTA